jgi:hypothetical protein
VNIACEGFGLVVVIRGAMALLLLVLLCMSFFLWSSYENVIPMMNSLSHLTKVSTVQSKKKKYVWITFKLFSAF